MFTREYFEDFDYNISSNPETLNQLDFKTNTDYVIDTEKLYVEQKFCDIGTIYAFIDFGRGYVLKFHQKKLIKMYESNLGFIDRYRFASEEEINYFEACVVKNKYLDSTEYENYLLQQFIQENIL